MILLLSMGITTILVLLMLELLSGYSLNPLPILMISGLAVCLEQIGPWGIDNITVPIGVAYAWTWMTSL